MKKNKRWKEDKITTKTEIKKMKSQEGITKGKIEEDQYSDFALFILSFMIQGSF